MRKLNSLLLLLILTIICPALAQAQLQRSEAFKGKYKLKEVVILSRHNIRSPLSTNGSALSKMTPHEWTNWSSAASELTLRGGVLETEMGQFFRKWTIETGLFKDNYVPTIDEVNVYANSMQRCIATAQYFSGGFMPVANLRVNHRYVPSKMDPIFFPRLTKSTEAFRTEAMKQINAMGGKEGLVGINKSLKESYDLIAKVLDMKQSEYYKKGEIKDFVNNDTQITLELNQEPGMKGSLKNANSASDAFILQYYEEPDGMKAAFGHKLTTEDWTKIAKVKDVYGDVLFTAPIVAVNVAHPLLQYMYDELNDKDRKFTFLCGHDSNIASVDAALGVEEYSLPNSIEKKTPIGSKLVLEKWVDAAGKAYIAVNLVYQSTDQLKQMSLLDLQHAPQVFSLKLKGLNQNTDGLYTFEDVNARFLQAIRAYDDIK
ncbi:MULTISPECIES: histidine-type phosphatase [Prevotella]|jgi:putative glucose-1-phosphatase|uniref:Histidine-type phosphatase n=1 Tax=Prevotella melaninogenica TaxID=28132 RepID=A0ABS6Y3J4_9BACT|nr:MULTISPECIES: histidine-type phosphatase [Prevotella]ETS99107.1 putative glucose-1-phosphatase [Prevotella sp. ICM33]MBF1600729.1 histidine-type phosphatase [Prevotella sp.]MBF1611398.1 histidine-type phosphatase [Prevotella sp.]MBF1617506.1 histidine-type phosphatase [Prevotella sp.]MBF1621132.1 histidine-type phosphatase [Prevotella sp.]